MAVTVLECRPDLPISPRRREAFDRLGVRIVRIPVVSPCPEYGTSYRVLACEAYEARGGGRLMIFLDSDSLILCEPDFGLAGADVAARPVDLRGVCTTGEGDENDAYWRALCGVCRVDYEQLPWVTTTVDHCQVKACYNGGLTVVHSDHGLFARTADFFRRSLEAGLRTRRDEGVGFSAGHGDVCVRGERLRGSSQACMSVAAASPGLDVRILPEGQNFPLHYYHHLLAEGLFDRPVLIAHAHYHHHLRDPAARNPLLEDGPGFPEDGRAWLRHRLGARD